MNKSKEHSKIINDGGDALGDTAKHAKDPQIIANASLIERYVEGILRIHVYFGWRCVQGSDRTVAGFQKYIEDRFCLVFQALPHRVVHLNSMDSIIQCDIDSLVDRPFIYDDGQAVFVDVVELSEPMQVGSNLIHRHNRILSSVWLKKLNLCESGGADVFRKLFEDLFGSIVVANTDRKLGVLANTNGVPVEQRQLTGKVVQARPEIANHITDDESPFGWWIGNGNRSLPLRLLLGHHSVCGLTRRYVGIESSLQILEVVISPPDFSANSVESCERMRHGQEDSENA